MQRYNSQIIELDFYRVHRTFPLLFEKQSCTHFLAYINIIGSFNSALAILANLQSNIPAVVKKQE